MSSSTVFHFVWSFSGILICNIIPVLVAWFPWYKTKREGLWHGELGSVRGAGCWPHFPSLFKNLHPGEISTVHSCSAKNLECRQFRPCVTQTILRRGQEKINKLKPHWDITTAVLCHNITSFPERSKELWREDAEQEALGKHLQDGCAADNPKMFWLQQVVLCLPLVWFSPSLEDNCPLKWFAQYSLGRYFLSFSRQEALRGQWKREIKFLQAF